MQLITTIPIQLPWTFQLHYDVFFSGATKKLKLSNGKDGHNTMKVGVLISGSGTNLQALIDQSLRHNSHAQIVLVISNVPGVQGLKRAENVDIPTKVRDSVTHLHSFLIYLICNQ